MILYNLSECLDHLKINDELALDGLHFLSGYIWDPCIVWYASIRIRWEDLIYILEILSRSKYVATHRLKSTQVW